MHFFKINELLNRRFGNVNNIFLLVLSFLSVYEKKNPLESMKIMKISTSKGYYQILQILKAYRYFKCTLFTVCMVYCENMVIFQDTDAVVLGPPEGNLGHLTEPGNTDQGHQGTSKLNHTNKSFMYKNT